MVETLAVPAGRRSGSPAARPRPAGTIEALIEVDLTGERTGVPPEELDGVRPARSAALEGLALTGLMTLPPIPTDPEDARPFFVAAP